MSVIINKFVEACLKVERVNGEGVDMKRWVGVTWGGFLRFLRQFFFVIEHGWVGLG